MSKWNESHQLFEQSSQHLAGGVSSLLRRGAHPAPLFVERGAGSRLFDVDGNEYIDYVMAYGPLIHGHAHPVLVETVQKQLESGVTYGAQHRGEFELARRLTEHVPCADLVCYANSGTEAVMVALRLARAFTGKNKILRFEGHYHGWADPILANPNKAAGHNRWTAQPVTAGQSPASHQDVVVLPWNDPDALRAVLEDEGHTIAGMIMEPVLCNNGCIEPAPGYLELARELASRHNVLLIFDEVITGFRLSLGGAQGRFGVTPDLCVLGKAIAGGPPLSAVGGRRDIMRIIAEGKVNHMGTLNGNPLVTASAVAAIDLLADEEYDAFARMEALTEQLVSGLRGLAREHGVPLLINHVGPVFHTLFTERDDINAYTDFVQSVDADRCRRFSQELFREGVFVRPSGLWYLSTVHDERDIEETLDAACRALTRLRNES